MKLIFRLLGRCAPAAALAVFLKLLGTLAELLLPYILEYMIDEVVPLGRLDRVLLWGGVMLGAAVLCWAFNVLANRQAIHNAHIISYALRQELFCKTANLTGAQFDHFTLPSLISRMTSDSYNVQLAVQQLQSLCVRAPLMLVGGVMLTLLMDVPLALALVALVPLLLSIAFLVSRRGIPLYNRVQQRLDAVVRVMRENITGIRVVKALSKEDCERRRFAAASQQMTDDDIHASTIMAIPTPLMQLCLNIGLTLVVVLGAWRVNAGQIRPGVVLAFLTYFNMINMGVMGLNRIFMTLSKASASANRIDAVLQAPAGPRVLSAAEAKQPSGEGFVRFERVSFRYGGAGAADTDREKVLDNISFTLQKGESLGIIGPTGCGKSTILNLLLRFYDADEGGVFVDGKDVRSYEKDALHRKFGVVFQSDMVFRDTLRENIDFGRGLDADALDRAVRDSQAEEYISGLEGGLDYKAAIQGANLSGGQKQRLLVARALAGRPEILVLDDSSSALDYRTDAAMRRAIGEDYADSTLILVAQRVSSVMSMSRILVLDNGRCAGYGTHQELLERCPAYREIYDTQMGAMA